MPLAWHAGIVAQSRAHMAQHAMYAPPAEGEITKNYPGVTREDILACLAYAIDLLKSEKVFPFPPCLPGASRDLASALPPGSAEER
jgi:hypothetical protein